MGSSDGPSACQPLPELQTSRTRHDKNTTRDLKMDLPSKPSQPYRKHFIPLESNPEVFTALTHKLGVAESLEFQDVLSLDDLDLLAFLPRPAYALVLVLPATEQYEARVTEEESNREEGQPCSDVLFFKQTINNACGLYAILHAVCNGGARTKLSMSTTRNKFG
jgi:ubiquitin carboxyl-terminal hydrolase L3